MKKKIDVSVVMPIYNEEKYIENCIDSLLRQDYDKDKMEWIFVDGMSNDNTKELLKKYKKKYPELIVILENPDKTVPYAMNKGIKSSKGKYIIRLDAHAEYAENYIGKCVGYLENMDIDNVGGILETKGRGKKGKIIAKMLSSKFGVGNSRFRTSSKSEFVDTVPFGAFKREVFDKYGLYDTRLTRNQDNELNYRIRKNGGKIYLANDIHLSYYCRDTLKGLIDMALKNGKWNIITMHLCPGSMGVRHFIPLVFVVSQLLLIIGMFFYNKFFIVLLLEWLLYAVIDIIYSFKISNRISDFFNLLIMFPSFHISYGIGSMIGIFSILKLKFGGEKI